MGVISILNLQEPVNGWLGIWEFVETCSILVSNFGFTEKEKQEFDQILSEKRKCEFLAVRILLHELMQKKKELLYDAAGKPYIYDDLHISISHSAELAVILISEKQAGIDVECLHRKTDKVAIRFLSEKEIQQVDSTPDPAFTRIIYWCAKEALFKCTPLTGIDFKNHIEIKPFLPEPDSGRFCGQLFKNNQPAEFVFHYFIMNNNVIVYCMEVEK